MPRPAPLALLLLVAGCAPELLGPDDSQGARELSFVEDLGALPDLASAPRLDLAADVDLAGSCALPQLRVNEVQTIGPSGDDSDEWVELYNPCAIPVDTNGGRLVYRSATNTTNNDTYTLLTLSALLPSHAHYLIVNNGYTGAAIADARFSAGALSYPGGAVGLRDAAGKLLDSVGWGTASSNLVEAASAAAPGNGKSIARKPDGHDSDDNENDFTVGTPTPGAAN